MDVERLTDDTDNLDSIKTILIMNEQMAHRWEGRHVGRAVFHACNCSEYRCETTLDKTKFGVAAALIFQPNKGGFSSERLRARPEQIFVVRSNEAPLRGKENIKLHYKDLFNLTMTYRRESDIRVPNWRLIRRTEPNLSGGISVGKVMTKSRTAVGFISHCHTPGSQRLRYVTELRKYVDVDIYGDCGHLSCPKHQPIDCFRNVSDTYYFYLAFENAFCKDYLTEKILHGWQYDMVPVVLGSYDDVLPPNSALDVRDFANPRELAERMKSLRNNITEYMKYFEFKKFYDITHHDCDRGLCRLCEILHDPDYQFKSGFDFYQWWMGQGECLSDKEIGPLLGLD